MLVMVRYCDNDYDIVEDYCLEYLIVTGKIVEFSRSDQWIKVGSEPIGALHEKSAYMERTPRPGRKRRKSYVVVQ